MEDTPQLTIYGIANCDKVRAVRTWCQRNGYHCQMHDYRRQGLDASLIKEFLRHFSLDELVNKRSATWRQLDKNTRNHLTPDTLIQYPTLIKRPIVHANGHWWLGVTPQHLAEALA